MSTTGMSGFDSKKEIDLVPGKVTGIRSWDIGLGNKLLIGAYGGHWKPGENKAKCSSGFAHDVPTEACGCGFWAYWTNRPYSQMTVVGVIDGYGHTLIGPIGFRCAKARIRALSLPELTKPQTAELKHELFGKAAAEFKVPLYDTVEEMLEAHPLTSEYYDPDWRDDTIGGGWITLGGGNSVGNITVTSTTVATGGNWYFTSGSGGSNIIHFAGDGVIYGGGVGGSGGGGGSGEVTYGGGISSISVKWEE